MQNIENQTSRPKPSGNNLNERLNQRQNSVQKQQMTLARASDGFAPAIFRCFSHLKTAIHGRSRRVRYPRPHQCPWSGFWVWQSSSSLVWTFWHVMDWKHLETVLTVSSKEIASSCILRNSMYAVVTVDPRDSLVRESLINMLIASINMCKQIFGCPPGFPSGWDSICVSTCGTTRQYSVLWHKKSVEGHIDWTRTLQGPQRRFIFHLSPEDSWNISSELYPEAGGPVPGYRCRCKWHDFFHRMDLCPSQSSQSKLRGPEVIRSRARS